MIMLRHFYDDFMTFVPLQLPQLLDVTTMEEPQFYGDYVLLTFPLHNPYDLDEVMDMFEDDMELKRSITTSLCAPRNSGIAPARTRIRLSGRCSR